jgi:rhamnosyltransferase
MTLPLAPVKICSLVIPTKNGGLLFHQAMDALKKQSIWTQTELIVIDSGSLDDTVEVAKAAGAKVIEILPTEFNHGATRDLGISIASCELVILMVQDAVAEGTELLETILNSFQDAEVAGVYVRQRPKSDADLLTKRNLNNWLTGRKDKEIRKMLSIEWYESLPPMEKYLFCNFDNVCSAVRKSVWLKQQFGAVNFGEDIDWAERVLKMGYKIVYESSAVVVHSHDRPMSYEYKRTYVCHRKLYQQFKLHLVPSCKGIFRSWLYSTVQDIRYVGAQDASIATKLALWAKVPILNYLSAIAQYRAARDEATGYVRKIVGV